MFKILCLSCVLALIVGSAFRFTLLAAGLAEARVLPDSWRRWLYDLNRVEKVH
jgi:hypothetical protein